MDILALASSYFENGAVPTAKVFADEVWRPNYVNFNSDEKLAVSVMSDYIHCYHRMGTGYMTGAMFITEYRNVIDNADKVNTLLSHPLDIDLFKKMHEEGLVKLKNREDARAAERKSIVEAQIIAIKDSVIGFNDRLAQIAALTHSLENDIKVLSNSLSDENITLSMGADASTVIVDKKPTQHTYQYYTYDRDTNSLTSIANPLANACDCCDCC
ncbi:MAG: hypothetical protein J6N72_08930 [Psychrobacter sp.]|nr:hypothetical protein [Psychrobacter sp.]